MRKYLSPTLFVLVAFILDTSVVPRFYQGVFSVPLMLVAVLLIGMAGGHSLGLLFGTLGGLLLDITTGTLGMMTFFFMAVGFLVGLMLKTLVKPVELPTRSNVRRARLRRVGWPFGLVLLGETVLLIIQYFYTARFEWAYVLNLLVRTTIVTLLTWLFYPLAARLISGPVRRQTSKPGQRASASDSRRQPSADSQKKEAKSF